ncbi:MAG: DUF3124 domain-containing protein [Syntrophales bacterium]|nr:DUF3124 domain-containing protein [Syntrophales bacterium]MDD5641565.1 DUF3124 domain-containing protein [Syntrophales bacterium]
MPRRRIKVCLLVLLMTYVLPLGLGMAAPEEKLSKGQLLYVPVYSHVYYGDQEKQILLTAILSIRNTDPARAITLTQVDYYDSEGKPVKSYLTKPLTLKPLASTRFIVAESDRRGGSGASFLVRWQADAKVNLPLMEGVMIGTAGQQGISFTTRGVEIKK